jgi:hypothetical protein
MRSAKRAALLCFRKPEANDEICEQSSGIAAFSRDWIAFNVLFTR